MNNSSITYKNDDRTPSIAHFEFDDDLTATEFVQNVVIPMMRAMSYQDSVIFNGFDEASFILFEEMRVSGDSVKEYDRDDF